MLYLSWKLESLDNNVLGNQVVLGKNTNTITQKMASGTYIQGPDSI